MKSARIMNNYLTQGLLLGALSLAASSAGAVDYYLATKAYTKIMPDGSSVPMWGYVEDVGGACYSLPGRGARLACVNAIPDPTLPQGPRLTVVGDVLQIMLTNGLPEPTSIVIPGQEMPDSQANNDGPTWNNGSTGARTNPTQRVRSFGREANANGGKQRYRWNSSNNANNTYDTKFTRSGTYIYHSGTHPQKQVYMGLYGAVTKDSAVGEAYPAVGSSSAVAYDEEVVLFYSEIDPVLNASVACAPNAVPCPDGIEPYSTSINYHAQWFLINGEPYADTMAAIPAGTANSPTLLRFLSAAGETHVPVLNGLHMNIVAEDGMRFTYQDGATATAAAPREQYSVMLPPLKTKDAIIRPAAAGQYAIYDGNGYMTDPSDPGDPNAEDSLGGMLRFLDVGGAIPPNTMQFSTVGNVAVPGGSNPDDADIYNFDGVSFATVFDASAAGLPANADIDGLSIVGTDTYVSFKRNGGTTVPGYGVAQDEDVLLYNGATWSLFFDGSASCGGLIENGLDLDAISVSGTTLYFSTVGGAGNIDDIDGLPLSRDDSDIYSFDGTNCAMVLDASTVGVPGYADVDGLSFDGAVYYMSFVADGTVVGGVTAQDEDVLAYDGTTWTSYINGTGLDTDDGLDVDALSIP
jgi:hypothetical protein